MCLDKYGRWDHGVRFGTLMRQTKDSVWILWDNLPDAEVWSQGDARYEVDRGRWRITGPSRLNPLEAIAGVSKSSPPPGAPALTSPNPDASIMASPTNGRKTEGGKKMAEQTTLSAKQVATKLGTDAKTFRRFLRSNACTVEPVGQGGRYEFHTKDVEALKNQFLSWRKPAAGGTKTTASPKTEKRAKTQGPTPRKKHKIDDDPPEIRLLHSIAERQRAAEMANSIEAKLGDTAEEIDALRQGETIEEDPTEEELAELEIESELNSLDDIDLEDLDD